MRTRLFIICAVSSYRFGCSFSFFFANLFLSVLLVYCTDKNDCRQRDEFHKITFDKADLMLAQKITNRILDSVSVSMAGDPVVTFDDCFPKVCQNMKNYFQPATSSKVKPLAPDAGLKTAVFLAILAMSDTEEYDGNLSDIYAFADEFRTDNSFWEPAITGLARRFWCGFPAAVSFVFVSAKRKFLFRNSHIFFSSCATTRKVACCR